MLDAYFYIYKDVFLCRGGRPGPSRGERAGAGRRRRGAARSCGPARDPAPDPVPDRPEEYRASDEEHERLVVEHGTHRRVRALPAEQGGTVPAAALTAFARDEDRAAALAAGFDAHVSKPVEPGALVATVARLLADDEGRREARRQDRQETCASAAS